MRALLTAALLSLCLLPQAWSADLRQAIQSAEMQLAERHSQNAESRQRINHSRANLQAEIERVSKQLAALEAEKLKQQQRSAALATSVNTLTEQRNQLDKVVGRIVAIVRTAAKNLRDLSIASPFSAFAPERLMQLDTIADGTQFPGAGELATLFRYFDDEIRQTSEVSLQPYQLISRDGLTRTVSLLSAGPFMTLALKDSGAEPVIYDPASSTFKELPDQPGWLLQRGLNQYIQGESNSLLLDLSSGAALDQLRRTPNLWQRISAGGPLVWPILLIGVIGLVIGIERLLFIKRVQGDTDNAMGQISDLASKQDWHSCDQLLAQHKRTPVYNVLRQGLLAKDQQREVLETVLQEAILKELPRLERFLPFLAILGAVAPLLGLLGTVTGMIDTFEVIHVAGTGDAQLMSGGISTALITTMLGLAVAIPIMLLHSVLNRKVEHVIGDMEEKAVALTNVVYREALVVSEGRAA